MYQYEWTYDTGIEYIEVMCQGTNEYFFHSKRGLTGTKKSKGVFYENKKNNS